MLKRCTFLSLFFCFTFLLLLTSNSFAKTSDFINQEYDFTKVRAILILQPKPYPTITDEGFLQDIQTTFNQVVKVKKAKTFTLEQIYNQMQIDTGIDLMELQKTDPEKATEKFNSLVNNYVDVIISTEVITYETGSRTQPGEYQTKTYKENYYDSGSKRYKERTKTRQVYVPEHEVATMDIYIKFDVINAKDNTSIYTSSNSRHREPGFMQKTKPTSMYERALKSFFKDFNQKLK